MILVFAVAGAVFAAGRCVPFKINHYCMEGLRYQCPVDRPVTKTVRTASIDGCLTCVERNGYDYNPIYDDLIGDCVSCVEYDKEKPYWTGSECSSFEEVEYIQSTGTQFIDTKYLPNPDTELILDLELVGDFTPTNTTFLGASDDDHTWYSFNFGGASHQANHIYCWPDGNYQNGAPIKNIIATSIKSRQILNITPTSASLSAGGSVTYNAKAHTHKNNTMYLFAVNRYSSDITILSAYKMLWLAKFHKKYLLV